MDIASFVGKLLEQDDVDALREGIRVFAQAVMETEVSRRRSADGPPATALSAGKPAGGRSGPCSRWLRVFASAVGSWTTLRSRDDTSLLQARRPRPGTRGAPPQSMMPGRAPAKPRISRRASRSADRAPWAKTQEDGSAKSMQ
jgi:hypothetical protein